MSVSLVALSGVPGGAVSAAREERSSSPSEYTARLGLLEANLVKDPESLLLGAAYRQAAIDAGAYDRAIKFLSALARGTGAGAHASITLALAYVDKVPVSGSIRQLYLGRDAIEALTRSLEQERSTFAYMVRGLINLYYDTLVFRRTAKGVADLEEAHRRAADDHHPYVARIYVALGDGYWRLKNPAKAHTTWREGLDRFPENELLRARTVATDDIIRGLIAHALDPDIRVDTTLRDVLD